MKADEIFKRATIRGIADYLLYGQDQDEDNRTYEERLDEPYMKFEKAVAKYDQNPASELLDLSNEISDETACVYMEIGIQAGILLLKDILKNLGADKQEYFESVGNEESFNANQTLLEGLYKQRVENAWEEVLMKDRKYQKINENTRRKLKEIDKLGLNKDDATVIDNALSATNELCAEYGRVSYRQGFLDAVSLLKK